MALCALSLLGAAGILSIQVYYARSFSDRSYGILGACLYMIGALILFPEPFARPAGGLVTTFKFHGIRADWIDSFLSLRIGTHALACLPTTASASRSVRTVVLQDTFKIVWGRAKAVVTGDNSGLSVPPEGLKENHNSNHIPNVYPYPAAATLAQSCCVRQSGSAQ